MLFLLVGCASTAFIPYPTDEADPSTLPPTPTGTPTPVFPPDSTRLRDVDIDQVGGVCAVLAVPLDGYALSCGGEPIEIEQRTVFDADQFCLEVFDQSDSCVATVGDLRALFDWRPTCEDIDRPPDAVVRVLECLGAVDSPTPSCSPVSVFPQPGSEAIHPKGPLVVHFAQYDPSVQLSVSSAGPVPGQQMWVGDAVVWRPNQPLAPNTAHQFRIEACGSVVVDHEFTTSDAGPGAPELGQRIFKLELNQPGPVIIQPPGAGQFLLQTLSDARLLMRFEPGGAGTVDLLTGIADLTGAQECVATTRAAGGLANPWFGISDFHTPGLALGPFELEGGFSADGHSFNGEIAGQVDARAVVDLVAPGSDAAAVCDQLLSYGVPCGGCVDGQSFCVPLHVANLLAFEQVGAELDEISPDDVDLSCDP